MATKKKVTKKSTAKKPTVSRATTSRSTVVHRSFRRSDPSRKFMETRFTEQTAYWLIIGAAVIGLTVWVLSIQVQLNDIYDDIDAQSTEVVMPSAKTPQL